jgi:hypothetical protein
MAIYNYIIRYCFQTIELIWIIAADIMAISAIINEGHYKQLEGGKVL